MPIPKDDSHNVSQFVNVLVQNEPEFRVWGEYKLTTSCLVPSRCH